MGTSIGELLATPELFWNWANDEAARVAVVHAVHELGLIDHILPGPNSIGEIAGRAQLDPELTRRLIEFLAAEGVLDVDAEGNFLTSDITAKFAGTRGVAYTYGLLSLAVMSLDDAVRAGNSPDALHLAMGKSLFQLFAENPRSARLFGEAMSFSTSATEPTTFLEHRFTPFEQAVDVGGSHGYLMMRLMSEYPDTRAIVFDLPENGDAARSAISAAGLSDRIDVVSGNFFEKVPEGGDLYLLKHILHDWNEDECVAILKSIREAMKPDGRVAVLERLVPDEYRPDIAYSFDIIMLLCTSGKERRLGDFEAMFAAAGLKLDRVTEVPGGVSVIEAMPI